MSPHQVWSTCTVNLAVGEQIWTSLLGLLLCPSCPPGRVRSVVAGGQHVRDPSSPYLGWTGVVGILGQTVGEGLVDWGDDVAHDPRQKPCDGFDRHRGSNLAPEHHEITDGHLNGGDELVVPFVDPFVAAT